MKEREQILVIGALLHDIGKFVQRASSDFNKKKHEEFGKEFLEGHLNIGDELKEEIVNIVLSHHEIEYNGKYSKLLDIVKSADVESAKYDRKKLAIPNKEINRTPLISVYSHVDIGNGTNKEVSYALRSLETKLNYPTTMISNSQQQYKALYKQFEKEMKNLTISDKNDVNTMLYILMKYTKYIPSAIYKSVADIPLYDHLKTTAAISLCKFRSDEDKKYLLIMGDLSGIQNFIFYNLKGGVSQRVYEHATKRMRGRSFLVNLIVDSAVRYIIHELDLYEFNILWESGGNFLILAPNNKYIHMELEKIRENVNKFLTGKFGRVYLNLTWVEKEKLTDFNHILEELHEEMDEVKSKKYIDFIRNENFYVEKSNSPYLCPVCGVHFVSSHDEICSVCEETENLGDKIAKAKYLLREIDGNVGDFVFEYDNIKIAYSLAYYIDKKNTTSSEIFTIDDFMLPKFGAMRGFRILKTHIPSVNSHVLTISDLVSMQDELRDRLNDEGGTKGRMAIFKADVDCLGEIFAKGLKSAERVTISLVSTLSFMMDLFFTQEINNIASKHNIYVVFSGGDDLTALGRYDEIIEFAKDVNKKFSNWTGYNENIHISGALGFFDEKFPIRRGVDIAEDELENAKNYKKINKCVEKGDLVSIFGCILPWQDFESQEDLGEKLWNAQKNKVIPSSLSHVLLVLHKFSPEFYASEPISKDKFIMPSPKPYLRYYFARRRSEEGENLLKELSNPKIFQYIPVAVSIWVMNRKYKRGE